MLEHDQITCEGIGDRSISEKKKVTKEECDRSISEKIHAANKKIISCCKYMGSIRYKI